MVCVVSHALRAEKNDCPAMKTGKKRQQAENETQEEGNESYEETIQQNKLSYEWTVTP